MSPHPNRCPRRQVLVSEFERCARFVLALPCYPRDPAWPRAWPGEDPGQEIGPDDAWREIPDGIDLVVLDAQACRAHRHGLREAFAAARVPGVHDPARDPGYHCLPEEACEAVLGPSGTRRPATRELLERLSPYATLPPWPSFDELADEARESAADADLLGGMLDLRRPLVHAAVARQESKTRRRAALAQLQTQTQALQDRVLAACRAASPSALRAALTGAHRAVLIIDPHADMPVRHLVPEERDDPALREDLPWPGSSLIAPGDGNELDPGLIEALVAFGQDVERLQEEIAVALDAWIARNLDHVVAIATEHVAASPNRDLLDQMRAIGLRYVPPPGGCPILGPCSPEGDEIAYLTLMAQARPCEAVLGLADPRQWPNLFDHLTRLPAHQRVPPRVLTPGAARMTFSGATDIRLTRRPGLVGRTRFEALRLGEQRTLTVPVPPDERNAYSRLQAGQILRVTAGTSGGSADLEDDAIAYEEIDLMVVASPRIVSAGRMTDQSLTRLAHREGMRPEAYRALVAGKGAGVVLSVKVVDVRAVTRADDEGRERARLQQRSLQRSIRTPARGRSR